MFGIFTSWVADASVEVTDGKTAVFEDVMDEDHNDYSSIGDQWKDFASEVATLASWSALQKRASVILGRATAKVDLDTKIKNGKALRKEALAFIRAFACQQQKCKLGSTRQSPRRRTTSCRPTRFRS